MVKTRFFIDFVGFSTLGNMISEATITVNPNWELKLVSDVLASPENARVIHLKFTKTKPKKERRIFELIERKSNE